MILKEKYFVIKCEIKSFFLYFRYYLKGTVYKISLAYFTHKVSLTIKAYHGPTST